MAAVMVNGLPGPMALETAKAVVRRGLTLATITLSGPSRTGPLDVDGVEVKYYQPQNHAQGIADAKAAYGDNLIVVDFTTPEACGKNAIMYVDEKIPFVMGSTGGDAEAMKQYVLEKGQKAVIAPNMCKSIVAVQSALNMMAAKYPNAFKGMDLTLTESHQVTKKDTSGTAKAMIGSFNDLGIPFTLDDVTKIRDVEEAKSFGVPSDAMQGHAYHTYDVKNNKDTQIVFQHNIVGRVPYAEGTVDAVVFLVTQKPGVYNMIDILEAGGMN